MFDSCGHCILISKIAVLSTQFEIGVTAEMQFTTPIINCVPKGSQIVTVGVSPSLSDGLIDVSSVLTDTVVRIIERQELS
jgi:hypothetical protein